MEESVLDIFVQDVMKSVITSLPSVEDVMSKGIEVVANPLYINAEEATEAVINEVIKVYKVKKTEAKRIVKVIAMEGN